MTELLDCQGLAKALHKHPTYVTAMKRAGYEMKHPAPGMTTLEHALAWLDARPSFRAFDYQRKGWQRLPKFPAAAVVAAVSREAAMPPETREIPSATPEREGVLYRAPALAKELGVPTTFVRDMHRGGFPMPGGRATTGWALSWLEKHPDFSPSASRRKQLPGGNVKDGARPGRLKDKTVRRRAVAEILSATGN